MVESPVVLLLLPIICVASHSLSAEWRLARMSCQIVIQQATQVTYIYRCVSCLGAGTPDHLSLELELHRCVGSQVGTVTRDIESHELEPLRRTDSMSIFHIPAGRDGDGLVRRIIDMLNPRQPRRHLHKYIFLWPGANLEQLHSLFSGCWAKQLLFGLAITRVDDGIFDFDPFPEGGLRVMRHRDHAASYSDKLRDLRGFELRYSMFTDPLMAIPIPPVARYGYRAVDGVAARVAAQILNANVTYVLPDDNESYGRCLPNGSVTGVVRDLISGKTHFGPNSRFVLDCMWPQVEVLYPHTRRMLYLVVPASDIQPEYLIFLRVFRRSVWHLLLANFLLVVLFFWLLQRLQKCVPRRWEMGRGFTFARWYEIVETFGKTHLGEPVERFSQISSMRAFLMCWILFSYVVTTIYFAKLESGFVRPTYEAQLDNLDGLSRLNVRIYAVTTLFDAVKSTLSERHYDLLTSRSRQLPLELTTSYYQLIVSRKDRRSAFIMRDFHARDFLALTYNAQTDRPSYHIVKEYLRSMLCTYIMPLGSPFLYKFQSLYTSFHEHGFYEHWRQMDLITRDGTSPNAEEFYEELGDQTDTDPAVSDAVGNRRKKHVVLTLDVLQGAFYLWSLGIALSSLGFVLEHGYFFWKKQTAGLTETV
ncbi:uncharacterized protein LOC6602327 [Drosophila persimilis]|nr:uncharacterized protein LOC6602327 [Drosophila persimilis]